MNHPVKQIIDDAETLAEDAGAFLDSTVSTAAKRYDDARQGLVAVLERGKDVYGTACRRAIRQTKVADGVLHDNLYQTVLIGIGIGALLGYLVSRHGTGERE